MFACVCACMSVLTHALRPGTFTITDGQKTPQSLFFSCSQPSASEPSILASPGPEGPQASRAVGEGRAKPAAAAPRSLLG